MNEINQEKTYHFLVASTKYYEDNSFDELLEEENKYGNKIYWHIGTDKVCHINKGDICLFYYSKLPDLSSRILFIGEVKNSDYGSDSRTSICPDGKPGMKYIEVKLKAISLEDSRTFSLENLRNKYNLIKAKGQLGHKILNKEEHNELIKDIDYYSSKNTHELKTVCQYFNTNYCSCFFKNHKTFIEENGFYYIERHHLVGRKYKTVYSNIPNIGSLIENSNNIFRLCPLCHRKIHHAKFSEKKDMIDKLYNSQREYYDTNFNELKEGKNTLEWLYSLYKIK